MESVSVIAVGDNSRGGCRIICGPTFLGCWVKGPSAGLFLGWKVSFLEFVNWSFVQVALLHPNDRTCGVETFAGGMVDEISPLITLPFVVWGASIWVLDVFVNTGWGEPWLQLVGGVGR